jgi:hypothetical protein
MTDSDDFLVASMAYCLSWEIGGVRAREHWQAIREYIQSSGALTETERWMCELYEESSPTAQEERFILSRINARLDHPRVVVSFRQSILTLMPEALAELAAKHRLMHSLAVPEGYGMLRTWLMQHKIARSRPAQSEPIPRPAREADFLKFIEYPYFLESLRSYWHQAPKFRNNKQTRVLLCIAAAMSQMLTCDDAQELQVWVERMRKIVNFTMQTQADLADLCLAMMDASYDAQELAYLLFVDANKVDRINFITFCDRHSDELTDFARDMVRGMQMTF